MSFRKSWHPRSCVSRTGNLSVKSKSSISNHYHSLHRRPSRFIFALSHWTTVIFLHTTTRKQTSDRSAMNQCSEKIARWIILRTDDIHAPCMRPPSSHWLLILTTRPAGPIPGCICESHARNLTCPAMIFLRASKLLQAFTWPDPGMSLCSHKNNTRGQMIAAPCVRGYPKASVSRGEYNGNARSRPSRICSELRWGIENFAQLTYLLPRRCLVTAPALWEPLRCAYFGVLLQRQTFKLSNTCHETHSESQHDSTKLCNLIHNDPDAGAFLLALESVLTIVF